METSVERRRYPRHKVLSAVVVTPNGHGYDTQVLDISSGGARVANPGTWMPDAGASLKLMFLSESDEPIVLHAHITRASTDQLGVSFDETQDSDIQHVLEMLDQH